MATPVQARHRVRAGVIEYAGAVPALRPIELDGPAAGEVLVRVRAAGICHTDLAWADGRFGNAFPSVAGHEIAGVVEEVGSGVSAVRPGARVIVSAVHACGRCVACERGEEPLCLHRDERRERLFDARGPIVQAFGTGGFAEACVVAASAVVQVPDDVPYAVAAVAGCAVATGFGAVLRVARIRADATVAVLGCGAVGLAIVIACRHAGARRIAVVDPNDERARLALSLGATDAADPVTASLRALEPLGYDVVFEAAGSADAGAVAVDACRRGGEVVLCGLPRPGETLSLDYATLVIDAKRVTGCNMGNVSPQVDLPAWLDLHCRGLVDLGPLVSATYPLAHIGAAFAHARLGIGARTVLVS